MILDHKGVKNIVFLISRIMYYLDKEFKKN